MGQTRKKSYNSLNDMTVQEVIKIASHGRGIQSVKGIPLFVVKYGPPGSGKSSENVYTAIKKLGPSMTSYIDMNQDTLVESMKSYQTNHTRYNEVRYQKNKKGMSLSEKSTIVLKKAIKARANIIIEITGGYEERKGPLSWIHTLLHDTSYKLIVIMPQVGIETILKRLEKRTRTRNNEEVKKEYEISLQNFDRFIKEKETVILVDNS